MFPDGNRTRIFPFARAALSQLSYQVDNQSTTARPKFTTDKRRVGNPAIWRLGRDLNPLILADLADNPNSTARRKWRARWESNPRFPKMNPGVLSQLNYGTSHKAAQIFAQLCGCGSVPSAARLHGSAKSDGQEVLWLRNRKAGLEPAFPELASGRSIEVELHPRSVSFGWAIIHNERPIEIGVTNRIRTGTNAFTGRDAAVTS